MVLLWTLVFKRCYGYGVRLRRILATGLAVIAICAVIFGTVGRHHVRRAGTAAAMNQTATEAPRTTSSDEPIGPWEALYFSVVTFTTIGYGDFQPHGWARVVAGLEGLLGLFIMAVFTVSFARKMLR